MRRRFVLLMLLSFHACKDEATPPPPHVSTVQLSVEDVSCTEAWLKVSLTEDDVFYVCLARRKQKKPHLTI